MQDVLAISDCLRRWRILPARMATVVPNAAAAVARGLLKLRYREASNLRNVRLADATQRGATRIVTIVTANERR